jgi:hypothetical protein
MVAETVPVEIDMAARGCALTDYAESLREARQLAGRLRAAVRVLRDLSIALSRGRNLEEDFDLDRLLNAETVRTLDREMKSHVGELKRLRKQLASYGLALPDEDLGFDEGYPKDEPRSEETYCYPTAQEVMTGRKPGPLFGPAAC